LSDGTRDRLKEIPLKGILTQKFHRQNGRTDEGAENPRELAAQQKIAREPAEKDSASDSRAAAEFAQ
jgi:hypothetical protein